jgi:hypothetical protein
MSLSTFIAIARVLGATAEREGNCNQVIILGLSSGESPMNPRQQAAMTALQNALLNQRNINTPLPNIGTSTQGYVFTEVQGVTVCIGPDGGYILPAVRSYQNSLQAAVNAAVELRTALGLIRVDTNRES